MNTMNPDQVLRDRYRSSWICRECVGDEDLRAYITSSDGELRTWTFDVVE